MADSEDKKPEKKEGGEGSLNIRIRDQTGEETFFKVKKTTKLDKVFNAYSTRKGVRATDLRFLYDGQRVRGDETPGKCGTPPVCMAAPTAISSTACASRAAASLYCKSYSGPKESA